MRVLAGRAASRLLHERRECPWERLAGLELDDPASERPPELEGEERVSTRELVEPAQLRTREHEPEPTAQQVADGPETERTDHEALEPPLRESALESKRCLILAAPQTEESGDTLLAKAAKGELEHESGGWIEPLDVVHGEGDVVVVGESAQRSEKGARDRQLIRRRPI